MASAVAHRYHYEPNLSQPVHAREIRAPGNVVSLNLRARINVVADRINLRGVEIERLVHCSIQISNAISSFDLETLRKIVAGLEQQA